MEDKTGGQAFPQFGAISAQDDKYDSMYFGGQGMALLDYFAAAALAGLLADSELKATPNVYARDAYEYARAMLEEKRRGEK